jgi:hypothetical protein
MTAPKAIPYSMQSMMMNDTERARHMQLQAIREQHAADDAARLASGMTTVLAITSFTIFDGENPRGRIINAGEQFEFPTFDLEAYAGKVVPAEMFRRGL